MDQRDQELLDKQLRAVSSGSRNDGVMILAVLAVFFAGMTLGVFLEYKNEPTRIASNDPTAAVSFSSGVAPTMRP